MSEALRLDQGSLSGDVDVPDYVAVQRVCVRLLFDPVFVARVYDDPGAALAPLEIPRALVDQLVANDRRLWGADRLRRSRALKVLMEELKVTTALVLAESRRLSLLEEFFSSDLFHEAVQHRRYMTLAFVSYLDTLCREGTLTSQQTRAVLALEGGMALARRLEREARRGRDPLLDAADSETGPERLARSPGVVAVSVPGGTLAVVQHVERYLFEVGLIPALVLCDDAPRPEPLPAVDPGAEEAWLLEARPGGKVDLGELPLRFAHVVEALDRPRSASELRRRLAAHGLAASKVDELVEALLEAGVLRRVP